MELSAIAYIKKSKLVLISLSYSHLFCVFVCFQFQQQLQQQQQQGGQPSASATATLSTSSTAPLVNGTSPSNQPAPQQPSPGKITTPTPTPSSTTVPISAAAVPSNVSMAPINNGTVVTSTAQQQLPSSSQPKQSNAATPILKPPPSVARPRPQPFNPSPFTRHMSLRYRSNPLSFMPLRGDTSGYETLTEEPSVPQLPPPMDAITLQNTTPFTTSGAQPTGPQSSTPRQPNNMYNGLGANSPSSVQAPNTLLNLSRGGNVPSTAAVPSPPFASSSASPQVKGPTQWSTPTQQPHPVKPQPRLSDAEMWLATASGKAVESAGTTAQPNQGLLTTVNPFAETASQIDALSNAWTSDLKTTLPSSGTSSQGNTSWSAAAASWGQSSAHTTNGNDFASLFDSRQISSPPRVPLTKKDSNPFSPSGHDQVFWV